MESLLEEYNVVDINRCQVGRWQSNSGTYYPSATNSLCTNYIKTNILKTNVISVKNNTISVIIDEYNADKTFLRGVVTNYLSVGQNYTISSDAVYITLSFPNTYTDFSVIGYRFNKNIEKPNYETKRVLCIGDSLTQGVDYNDHVIAEGYPYFLEKDFNIKTFNHGFMGTTASTWYNTRMQYVNFNYTFDVALIMLGTNGGLTDTLDTDVLPYDDYNNFANTNTGNYCKIIEKIMELSSKTQIILMIPPYNYFNEEKHSVLLTAVDVIPKIAELYSLPIIDLYRCSGMNYKNGDIFRPHDNLHFNAKGYHKMATYIGNQLKSLYSYYYDSDVYTDEYYS
jgi:lysophospholipase L1-like esterase